MTEITIGAPFGVDYFKLDGTLGQPVTTAMIEAFNAAVDARVSSTSGEGAKTFVATAAYDDTTGVLSFTAYLGGAPSAINVGDLIIFAAPSDIDDDQDITVDDTVNARVDALYDLDDNVVQGHRLSPGRVYGIRRLVRGAGQRYRLTLPLGLDQINPVKTASVTITNAQLKTLDTDPVEIIPAPGAGKTIEILRSKVTGMGSDPLKSVDDGGTSTTPDSQSVWFYSYFVLGFIIDDTATKPPLVIPGSGGVFEGSLDDATPFLTYWQNSVVAADGVAFHLVGGRQVLRENSALEAFAALNAATFSRDHRYSAAAWDDMWSTGNDNTVEVEVDYYIHSI